MEISAFELRAESKLPRASEALLERRLCFLVSLGSLGFRPLARAKRFRMSVNDTTPDNRPDILTPGSAAAEMEGEAAVGVKEGVA